MPNIQVWNVGGNNITSLADSIYGDYNVDSSTFHITKDQVTWKGLIVRVIPNNFPGFDNGPYGVSLDTPFKHALHGVLAENDLLAVHSIDQLIFPSRLPTVI
jgi:hypothetical protein